MALKEIGQNQKLFTHRDNRAGIVQLVAEHQRRPVGLQAGVELLGDVVGAVLGGEELLVGQVGVGVDALGRGGPVKDRWK